MDSTRVRCAFPMIYIMRSKWDMNVALPIKISLSHMNIEHARCRCVTIEIISSIKAMRRMDLTHSANWAERHNDLHLLRSIVDCFIRCCDFASVKMLFFPPCRCRQTDNFHDEMVHFTYAAKYRIWSFTKNPYLYRSYLSVSNVLTLTHKPKLLSTVCCVSSTLSRNVRERTFREINFIFMMHNNSNQLFIIINRRATRWRREMFIVQLVRTAHFACVRANAHSRFPFSHSCHSDERKNDMKSQITAKWNQITRCNQSYYIYSFMFAIRRAGDWRVNSIVTALHPTWFIYSEKYRVDARWTNRCRWHT